MDKRTSQEKIAAGLKSQQSSPLIEYMDANDAIVDNLQKQITLLSEQTSLDRLINSPEFKTATKTAIIHHEFGKSFTYKWYRLRKWCNDRKKTIWGMIIMGILATAFWDAIKATVLIFFNAI